MIPRRLRRSPERPLVLLEVNTALVEDADALARELRATCRAAGVRSLVVDVADGAARFVEPWQGDLLTRLYGQELGARIAWFLAEHAPNQNGNWQRDPVDVDEALAIMRRDARTMASVYARPLTTGMRVRVTAGPDAGCLGRVIGPEARDGADYDDDVVPGWWIRTDSRDLRWFRDSHLRQLPADGA